MMIVRDFLVNALTFKAKEICGKWNGYAAAWPVDGWIAPS